MSIPLVTEMSIHRVSAGKTTDMKDLLATEEPLEIRLVYGKEKRKTNLAVTMRTPGNDEELAIGFMYAEGIIKSSNEVLSFEQIDDNIVQITLDEHVDVAEKKIERNFYTTSSCGVCGKASIDAIKTECNIYDKEKPFTLPASLIHTLPDKLGQVQSAFQDTGGIHAAALFNLTGDLLLVREDVGRHNALDKLVGAAIKSGSLPLNQHILLLSGRASFELIQKATMAGIKVVCAVGAPSSLAVQTADEFGITLVGFLKKERFNIYTEKQRVNS
ncbi:MAG: formate dehydrogenase accessory sulfurtransferase FdhD [Chitinophagaceae bacterium]|nr:formate dehydrogenase accessory sulfurtransferase FdhD [Chitinophagaceae bacterium]